MNLSVFQPKLSLEEQDKLIADWQKASEQLTRFKKLEMELRLRVDAELFGPTTKDYASGTMNRELGGGYILKNTRKINVSLNNKKFKSARAQLDKDVAERIGRTKYELDAREYKRLIEKAEDGDQHAMDQLVILEEAITTSQATPALKLVAPEA